MVAAIGPTGFDGSALGASAAAMGVVGALAAFPSRHRRFPVGPLIVVVLVVNIAGPLLDGAQHCISTIGHLAGPTADATYAYPHRSKAEQRRTVEQRRS